MRETLEHIRVGAEDSFKLSAGDAATFNEIDLRYNEEEFSRIEDGRVFNREKRREDDIVTWLAEVLPGTMATTIEYISEEEDLYTDDGQRVGEIFDDAIEDARFLPFDQVFELRRRRLEKDEYTDMIKMANGKLLNPQTGKKINTIVVESDFPPELMESSQDIGGYDSKRKTTMQRVITVTKKGIKITSFSLDGSNREALEAVYEYCGFKPQPGELLGQRMYLSLDEHTQKELPETLRDVYDTSLSKQFGGSWHGGRSEGDRRNTYDFIWQNYDLISHYLTTTNSFSGGMAEYSLAAAMTRRFNNNQQQKQIEPSGVSVAKIAALQSELNTAAHLAMVMGETFSGCGASISGNNDQTQNVREDLYKLGYGNMSRQDQYGPLEFECQNGHENKREYNNLIDNCTMCGVSVYCKTKEQEPKQPTYKGNYKVKKKGILNW